MIKIWILVNIYCDKSNNILHAKIYIVYYSQNFDQSECVNSEKVKMLQIGNKMEEIFGYLWKELYFWDSDILNVLRSSRVYMVTLVFLVLLMSMILKDHVQLAISSTFFIFFDDNISYIWFGWLVVSDIAHMLYLVSVRKKNLTIKRGVKC